MSELRTLLQAKSGRQYTVTSIPSEHLLKVGLYEGCKITVLVNCFGTKVIKINNQEISIGRKLAGQITINEVTDERANHC